MYCHFYTSDIYTMKMVNLCSRNMQLPFKIVRVKLCIDRLYLLLSSKFTFGRVSARGLNSFAQGNDQVFLVSSVINLRVSSNARNFWIICSVITFCRGIFPIGLTFYLKSNVAKIFHCHAWNADDIYTCANLQQTVIKVMLVLFRGKVFNMKPMKHSSVVYRDRPNTVFVRYSASPKVHNTNWNTIISSKPQLLVVK